MALESAQTHAVVDAVPVKSNALDGREDGRENDGDGLYRPLTVGQRARWVLADMVGRSAAMERLFLQMRYLARHLRVALIEGEPGTGKRLAVQTLHGLFVADGAPSMHGNAKLTVEQASMFLAEKDLREPLAQIQGGLLYLTHVDQLNADEQIRLKQLAGWLQRQGLHSGIRKPLSSSSYASGPVSEIPQAMPRALVAGSQKDLRSLVLRGEFRNDLYQQLSSVRLSLPPLRDRAEDIPMLVQHFLVQCVTQGSFTAMGCTQEALLSLLSYRWPGNVTELRAAVSQAAELASARACDGNGGGPLKGPIHRPGADLLQLQAEHFGLLLRPDSISFQGLSTNGGAAVSSPLPGQLRPSIGLLSGPKSGRPMRVRSNHKSYPEQAACLVRASSVVPWPTREPERRQGAIESTRMTQSAAGSPAWTAEEGSVQKPLVGKQPESVAGVAAGRHAIRRAHGVATSVPVARSRAASATLPTDLFASLNLDRAILEHIHKVLSYADGNKLRAARLLGISRSTLYRLLEAKPASRDCH